MLFSLATSFIEETFMDCVSRKYVFGLFKYHKIFNYLNTFFLEEYRKNVFSDFKSRKRKTVFSLTVVIDFQFQRQLLDSALQTSSALDNSFTLLVRNSPRFAI